MMKSIVTVLGLYLLVGCTPVTSTKTDIVLPEGLEQCKMYELRDSVGHNIIVLRCPNSQTTSAYMEGKIQRSVTVVEN